MTQNQPATSQSIAGFAQADVLLLLAKLWSPPALDDEDWSMLQRESDRLLDAAGLGDEALKSLLKKTLEAAAATGPRDWADEYTGLFEGSMPCPTGETAYIRRDKGAILADIVGFYRAFGFDLRAEAGEKADHLVGELEFLAMLLTMAAAARTHGSADDAQITEEAAETFAADHPGQWIDMAGARLTSLTSLTVYQRLGELTQTVWRALVARRGWRIAPPAAETPDPDDATPYECGMAPGQTRVQLQVHANATDLPR